MNKRPIFLLCLLISVSAVAVGLPMQQARTATEGSFSIALMGDSIITERLTPFKEPEYLGLMNLIRGADTAFANFEMLLHDYEGYPNALSGGTWMRADPVMAKELAWTGIRLV